MIKPWKCKDGTVKYKLPNCSICDRRSNTTDKETAQHAEKYGRVCRKCNIKFKEESLKYNDEVVLKKTIWQKICDWFYVNW